MQEYKAGDVIDSDFDDESEDKEIASRAAAPGATFTSAYGPMIYDDARRLLSNKALEYQLTSREREAVWPGILLGQVAMRAREALAQTLPEVPDDDALKREQRKAEQFAAAYEAVSGVALEHPARNPALNERGRAEARRLYGSPQLSAHERLDRARPAPAVLRAQAKELHDEGVCAYSESAIRQGEILAHGERDRNDSSAKRIRRMSKGEIQI